MVNSSIQREKDEEQIRILVICQVFPPESMGGAHRWKKFVENLPDNLNSHIICPLPAFPFGTFERRYRLWQKEEYDGVPVTRLWTFQPTKNGAYWQRILNNVIFSMMASMYVILNFWRYDRVITMAGPHTTFLPGIVSKALCRVWIIDVFDMWLDNAVDLGYIREKSLKYKIVSYFEKIAFTKSDHAILLTPTMADQYREKYDISEHRYTIVPFGVDNELFDPEVDFKLKNRIAYFGNLGEAQSFKPFFEGFSMIDGDLEFHIAGSGERRDELQKLCEHLGIADDVKFVGMIPRDQIPQFVGSSLLSVVPLKTGENYQLDYARPTKLLESLAIGTPVIASEVKEVETICDYSDGVIAVKNDPKEVAAAIDMLYENDQRRERMSHDAVNFISEHHQWDLLSKRVAEVIINP